MPRSLLPVVPLALLSALGGAAHAEPQRVALGVSYAHWEGTYTSQGAGGRIRWEPLAWFGVEGTAEVLSTTAGSSDRFDFPIGFNLYTPWALTPELRTRAFAGLCTMFSFASASGPGGGETDDILFGFRVGAGLEYALGERLTLFADAAWQRYLGHGREVSVWSDAIDGELESADQLAISLGLTVSL